MNAAACLCPGFLSAPSGVPGQLRGRGLDARTSACWRQSGVAASPCGIHVAVHQSRAGNEAVSAQHGTWGWVHSFLLGLVNTCRGAPGIFNSCMCYFCSLLLGSVLAHRETSTNALVQWIQQRSRYGGMFHMHGCCCSLQTGYMAKLQLKLRLVLLMMHELRNGNSVSTTVRASRINFKARR